MAITATPLDNGGIRVTVTQVAYGANARIAYLTRSDANGIANVRTLPNQIGRDSPAGNAVTVVDHEAALVGPVTYVTRWGVWNPGSVSPDLLFGSADETTTTTLEDVGPELRVASSVRPSFGATPTLLTGLAMTREHSNIAHEVIGRPDAVVSIGVQGLRRGTFELLCDTWEKAREVELALASNDIAMIRQGEYAGGLDMYFLPLQTNVMEDPNKQRAWLVSVSYVEQYRPEGPLLGALGWTVEALAASGLTVGNLPTVYPRVAALTIGPVG